MEPKNADFATANNHGDFDIEFINVTKHYGDVVALNDTNLKIPRGSFHSLLGPSGCGKTTSLRLIAGFEQPTSGDVRHRGVSMVGIPAYKRPVNMVFQHYAPFPHLNVEENISYGPRQRSPKPSKQELKKLVGEMLELVRLPGFQNRRIWQLSGGQLQRIVLARALINRPAVLLLDEPLAALDRKLRREMQMELQSLQREVGITFVLVTHDQEEALSMSDTISIMRDGGIVQTGNPSELYDTPVDRYVADFVGESNFFSGIVSAANSTQATIQTKTEMSLTAPYPEGGKPLTIGQRGAIAVRPEMVLIWPLTHEQPKDIDLSVKGRITNRIYLGHQAEFRVVTDSLGEILARIPKTAEAVTRDLAPGDEILLGWQWNFGLAMPDA
ncbi:ABC transporter ATP-binding protein [Desulfococcaceae bacterium HSG7]|nr:ABC transporter ATP-binding protein [Desulfococcaceae bacterium HSG7]